MNINSAVGVNLLQFQLFGSPQIQIAGEKVVGFSTNKSHALLIYLAYAGQPCSRETLASLLWPETTTERALKNLRDAIYNLRKVIGGHLESSPRSLSLSTNHQYSVDVTEFRRLLSDAHPRLYATPTALDLYSGDFLAGFTVRKAAEYMAWVESERNHLRQLAIGHSLKLIEAAHHNEEYESGLSTVDWLLEADPHNETAHYYKLSMLLMQGDRIAAFKHYEAYLALIFAIENDLDEQAASALNLNHAKTPAQRIVALVEGTFSAFELSTIALHTQGVYEHDDRTLPTQLTDPLSTELATQQLEQNRMNSGGVENLVLEHSHQMRFVGYENESQQLIRVISAGSCRLFSIIGAGGVGKTRLVAEVLSSMRAQPKRLARFSDGICYVPLSKVQPIEHDGVTQVSTGNSIEEQAVTKIVNAIADSLGIRFDGAAPPKEQLMTQLAPQGRLLILDNFEHLLAGASLVFEMLERCPNTMIVVTSRERLNHCAERCLYLHGLRPCYIDVHDSDVKDGTLDPSQGNDLATTLFLDRYQRLTARAQVNATQVGACDPSVQKICELTGGIPLAIELAASLATQMDLASLVRALEDDLGTLASTDKKFAPRHQCIWTMLDTTWKQLAKPEQEMLVRLATFKGGFTYSAATEVANATPPSLSTLVNKSILWVRQNRYEMHPLIHQYLQHRLAEYEEDGLLNVLAIQQGSFHYFQRFLSTRIDTWRQTHAASIVEELQAESENILGNWYYAVANEPDHAILDYANDLWHMERACGRLPEMEQIINGVLEQVQIYIEPVTRTKLLLLLTDTYYWQGKLSESLQCGLNAMRLCGAHIPQSRIALAVSLAGELLTVARRHLFSEWLNIGKSAAASTEKNAVAGHLCVGLCQNHYMLNELPYAALYALRAVNFSCGTKDNVLKTYANYHVSPLFSFFGLPAWAQKHMELARRAASDSSDLSAMAAIPFYEGLQLISAGKCVEAKPMVEQALSQCKEQHNWRMAGDCLALLNIIACHFGDHEQGLNYGYQMVAVAETGQNLEHYAWAELIQATNLLLLAQPEEALNHLASIEPLYDELAYKDIGLFVGYSTRALAHFHLSDYNAALNALSHLMALATHTFPTSAIYLYVHHAVLEVLLGLLEIISNEGGCTGKQAMRHLKTKDESFTLSDTTCRELRAWSRSWLYKLTLFTWLHPLGENYLLLHRGRYCRIQGNKRKALRLLTKGVINSQKRGEQRNYERFLAEIELLDV